MRANGDTNRRFVSLHKLLCRFLITLAESFEQEPEVTAHRLRYFALNAQIRQKETRVALLDHVGALAKISPTAGTPYSAQSFTIPLEGLRERRGRGKQGRGGNSAV